MNYFARSLAILGSCAFLSACGGGGGASAPVAHASAPASSKAKTTVAFVIKVPNKSTATSMRHVVKRGARRTAAHGKRTREYVGDGTQSGTLTVTPVGSTTPISTQTFSCTDTCDATASLVPGTYTFAVSLYNGANGTGDMLSSGVASKRIVASVANTVNLSFTGTAAYAGVFLDEPTGTGELAVGTPATAIVTVEVQDADGNDIMGTYDQSIVLKTSDPADASLSVPAVTATPDPGFDSPAVPNPTAEPAGASITITDSSQQPVLTWTGNGTADYDVVVEATIPQTDFLDSALLVVTGGATAPPAINKIDPLETPYPKLSPAAPTASPSAAAAAAAAPPIKLGTIGVPNTTATLMPSGSSLYAFVNGASKSVSLGLGSQVDAESDDRSRVQQQTNFMLSTNASGLATFDVTKTRTIDLNAGRVTAAAPRRHHEIHVALWHDLSKRGTRATARRGRDAFHGATPTVGVASSWYVGTINEAVTSRSIMNDKTTGKPRFVIWSANSSQVPASFIPTIQTDVQNADAALLPVFGDFHYPANAAGITTYTDCNPDGSTATTTSSSDVADPGYVNVVLFDGSLPGGGIPGADGYFSANDYTPQSEANCFKGTSNETPTIFIQYNPGTTLNGAALDELNLVVTHEYSHLLTYVLKTIDQAGPYELPWALEGLGSVSEDYTAPNALTGNGPLGAPTGPVYETNDNLNNISRFMSSPQSYTLTGFAGIENGAYVAGGPTDYGISYFFEKYLFDRFGIGFIHDLNYSTNQGEANIVYSADKNGAGTETFNQLFQDFVTMLAVSGTGESTDPKYNMKSFNIRGGTFPAQCAGCNPVVLSGPAYAADLTPGQSLVVQNMFPGGFAFFDMNGINAKGNVIKATDTTGALQLYGALGQK